MQTTTVAIISPPERVARSMPVNFQPGDEALFQHELVKDINAVKLLTMKDVHLLPNGFLSSKMRVVAQSFTSIPKGFPAIKRWIRMIAYQAAARETKDVERALFATDEFSNGYFHWVCDVLPRLEAIYNQETRQRTFLVPAMALFPYVAPSLEPYDFSSVCTCSWRERIRCSDLMVVTETAPTGNYRPSLMKSLRNRFRTYFSAGTAGRRLYISRARAPRRRTVNEAQVADVMTCHGFERVFLEDLSFQEQVRLVGSASVLAGNHGAGLANMAWMLPETTILELRLRGDSQNNCYFSLASALELKYCYLACDAASGQRNAHSADLVVDVRRLEQELSAIEEGRPR
jgi:capsular polysaccharide biosynthesis protein